MTSATTSKHDCYAIVGYALFVYATHKKKEWRCIQVHTLCIWQEDIIIYHLLKVNLLSEPTFQNALFFMILLLLALTWEELFGVLEPVKNLKSINEAFPKMNILLQFTSMYIGPLGVVVPYFHS
jgi:hypothetical protein